jgi:hypothetical protein
MSPRSFRATSDNTSLRNLVAEVECYFDVSEKVDRAMMLLREGHEKKANALFRSAAHTATKHIKENPRHKGGYLALAWIYMEARKPEHAQPVLEKLLSSPMFDLSANDRSTLEAELQNAKRQQTEADRSADEPSNYTQVYCCANCGRLINYVSMPCHHCDWSPGSKDEFVASMLLSNSTLDIGSLIGIGRGVEKGRTIYDLVPQLHSLQQSVCGNPKQMELVEATYSLLQESRQKPGRLLNEFCRCQQCKAELLLSDLDVCSECGGSIDWTPGSRLLVCVENVLNFLERRCEVPPSGSPTQAEHAEFVSLLVSMVTDLLRNQTVPSPTKRKRSLDVLAQLGVICDSGGGAVISTLDPSALEVYCVEDRMDASSMVFGQLIAAELRNFVTHMQGAGRPSRSD